MDGHSCDGWVALFRDRWDRWAARLAALQPEDDDGLIETFQDAKAIEQLVLKSQWRSWRGAAFRMLWEQQAFK